MGAFEGRVVVVTGAGRGIGREHALLFAREGARVVVNDLGASSTGAGADSGPAAELVEEIEAGGWSATANGDDVATWDGARRLVDTAIERYGDLDVLVNNAGILRDRTIVKMSEEEWDSVIRVHLKGHFAPLHFAAAHWRERAKAGDERPRAVVNTASESGLFANPGQSNYGAAKSGIATLTQIAAKELGRYGVRVNAVLPRARTRLTEGLVEAPDGAADDRLDPAQVSPPVAHLASDTCAINGQVFVVGGGLVQRVRPWELDESWKLELERPPSLDELAAAIAELPDLPGPPASPGSGGAGG